MASRSTSVRYPQRLQRLPRGQTQAEQRRAQSYEAWIRRGFLPQEAWYLANHGFRVTSKNLRTHTFVRRLTSVRKKLITKWVDFGFSSRQIFNFLYDLIENPLVGDNLEDQLRSVGSDPDEPINEALKPYSALLRSKKDVEDHFEFSLGLTVQTFSKDMYDLSIEDAKYWEELATKLLRK